MKFPWLLSFVALSILLFVPNHARGQPLVSRAKSIECVVANADLVIVARIVEFADQKKAEASTLHKATAAVEDVLKQDFFAKEPLQRVSVHLPYSASVLSRWMDQSCRLLLAIDEDAPTASKVIDLTDEGLEILTTDFTLLQSPEEVMKMARKAVRRMPASIKRIHTFGVRVPDEAIAGTRWEQYYQTGGHLVLNVPVDERLESRSHEYLRSDSYMQRVEGARALRYFKSDENIARLESLLHDPGWSYLRHPQHNDGLEVRHYGVRQEAYQTLKSWGVNPEEPVFREEVRN